jgi:6-pyruvoyl-tetrahydropterin synthase
MNQPKKLTLSVFYQFKASHSLSGFETPHFHLWKLAIEFSVDASFEGDRVVDLVYLQQKISEIVTPVDLQFLNQIFDFQPTTENIAQWLWKEVAKAISEAPLTAVTVTICNLEGDATGSARLSSEWVSGE